MYELLIGELLFRGGDAPKGTAYVLNAARRVGDESLFKRATEMAIQSRSGPAALEATLALEGQARDLADRYRFAENLIVLTRGLHYGVAQEAALKLKETSGIHAEAYSAAEFSHGPKRLLAEGLPVLAFTPADHAGAATRAALDALQGDGADLRTIGPASGSTLTTPGTGHGLTDTVPSALAFYLFAAHLSLARGLNPDQPPLLSKVTKTR